MSLAVFIFALFIGAAFCARAAVNSRPVRLVILMVWDGLRPDSVTPQATPNLYALRKRGAYFAAHHSIYPTLTMVNAAALATGTPPGINGILANKMYLAQLLENVSPQAGSPLAMARIKPASLEDSRLLEALSAPAALDGKLVEVQTVAQRLLSMGGFVGIVGKTGPTFLFDDRVDSKAGVPARELFISDRQTLPLSLAAMLRSGMERAAIAAVFREDPPFGDQDTRLADVLIRDALPRAAESVRKGRPALLVLWQHNPDITEHVAGLGTAPFYRALGICDGNLGRLVKALSKLGLADRTDLLVVSDHGFATIKTRIELADLLVAHGLKQSKTSDDVVVANNFGSDEIYLSPTLARDARARLLARIVAYSAAQEWCGPIFSRSLDPHHRGYAGEIPGTFDQAWFGLENPSRSADLIISFRELAEDNSNLTGPGFAAQVLGAAGIRTEPNRSQPLLHPVAGVSYADSGLRSTAGNGTHGALGEYEIHNFAAAAGPDFRRAYVDDAPSSNMDIARTIAQLLGADSGQNRTAPGSARALTEAMSDGSAPAPHRRLPLSVTLTLPDQRIVTTVQVDQVNGERYPAGAAVTRTPIKMSGSARAR